MKEYKFASILAPFIKKLLEIEGASEKSLHPLVSYMMEFDNYANSINLTDLNISEEIILNWRKTRVNDGIRTLHHKLSAWRKLLTIISQNGYICHLPRLPRIKNLEFTPHIFTKDELSSFWSILDNLKIQRLRMDTALMSLPAIFRLLYSTGIRVGECVSIKNSDVHLTEGYIVVKNTKNKRERIVALSETMQKVLEDYIVYRNQIPVKELTNPDANFFIKVDGTPIARHTIYINFRRIIDKCGIKYGGRNEGPCVHSFRHTYAVHSLLYMVNKGMNLYSALPILSASLGHQSLQATEYYLRLTRASYPEIEKVSSSINAFIYPSISQYYENEY